jgi:molybdopterin synthase catalytic subunit
MQIQVRYFAVLRERLGRDEDTLELAAGATAGDAVAALAERHGAIANLRGRCRVARNLVMVALDEPLADGDELALIPPVAGGHDRLARMVADRAPSLDRVVAAVTAAEIGAVVTFTGLVRSTNQGREVVRLEYEAYETMANKVLAELCDAIEAEIAGARLAVEHRCGSLVVGDIAVVIAAGAPHRAEAFAASRALIERLKQAVPIWKKEIGPDGAEWLGIGP